MRRSDAYRFANLVSGHPTLETISEAPLRTWTALLQEFQNVWVTLDGGHFGLTPKKYLSEEADYSGEISKIGDAEVRSALFEATNVILTRPVKASR
ncbi:transposase [Bradyrhizobium sp. I1.14.4]|uniref:transposase n=1 Tax=unclassified Bradyrhizobium TaxID=2631580 RepID=UPI003D216A54